MIEENFCNNSTLGLKNPAKSELARISKVILLAVFKNKSGPELEKK